MKVRSETLFRNQLVTAILSTPIVYIQSSDYGYVDRVLADILPSVSKQDKDYDKLVDKSLTGLCNDTIYQFDIGRGYVDFITKRPDANTSQINLFNVLNWLLSRDEDAPKDEYDTKEEFGLHHCKILLVKNCMQDLENGVSSSLLDDGPIQLVLQTFVQRYWRGDYDSRTTVIFVSPAPIASLPSGLKDLVMMVEILPPTIEEIRDKVDQLTVSKYQDAGRFELLKTDLCRTLQGLQMYDIDQILATMCARTGGYITERSSSYALEEKQRIVRKSNIIDVIDPSVTFDDIGGLQVLRDDIKQKAVVFKNLSLAASEKVGLPIPKGILIIGMPGCGKSMIAKSIAAEFGVSLLRLDISRLMGQYVGQSEENLRKALRTAEAAHPCVLWIDEIEKAFHGANSTNANENDSLVMRMMGYFLTWMQERKTAVYIVATANDVMRSEFMRKGRFDEVYFVDFPDKEEREAIFKAKIKTFSSTDIHNTIFDFSNIDYKLLSEKSGDKSKGGLTGAEIESVVNTLVEKKFVEYAQLKNEERPDIMSISTDEIIAIINKMMESALYKQTSKNSAIENIREMQKEYNFRSASQRRNENKN